MTSKTVKYTVYENTEAPTTWSNSDNDVTIVNDGTTHIITSDLDYTTARDGNVVRQGTFDLDLTKDMNFNARFYTSISGEEIVSSVNIVISPQGGNNYNLIARFLTETVSTILEDSIENDSFDDWCKFKINGVLKHSIDSITHGTQELGTHAHTWNGSDALSFEYEANQRNIDDSSYNTAFSVKFDIT